MNPHINISLKNRSMNRSMVLTDGFTSFGRFLKNDICLGDPSISRDHGAFRYQFQVLSIEDYGSRNGTFVNGLRVRRKVLYTGDRVQIGPFEVLIESGSALTVPVFEQPGTGL